MKTVTITIENSDLPTLLQLLSEAEQEGVIGQPFNTEIKPAPEGN